MSCLSKRPPNPPVRRENFSLLARDTQTLRDHKNLIFTTRATCLSGLPPAKLRLALLQELSPNCCCSNSARKSPATPFKLGTLGWNARRHGKRSKRPPPI